MIKMRAVTKQLLAASWLEIVPDHDPINPRENDNAVVISCRHSRYRLGDDDSRLPSEVSTEAELRRHVGELIVAISPVYLFDHSGITMSTKPFSCRWDSGQVGFAYVTAKMARQEWRRSKKFPSMRSWGEAMIEAEVSEYDRFLRGEAYGFRVREALLTQEEVDEAAFLFEEDAYGGECYGMRSIPDFLAKRGDEIDSCWGFDSAESAAADGLEALKFFREKLLNPEPARVM